MYQQVGGEGFEIIAVAQDSAGEKAAGPFYDAAEATYTTLIDTNHALSSLYSMINVPTGVLIDEAGIMVRHDEDAYSKVHSMNGFQFGNDRYRPVVLDWVEKGADSVYVQSPKDVTAPLQGGTDSEAEADALFKLGVYFYQAGNREFANRYWDDAQTLYPASWNMHRQDWSFLDSAETSRNWLSKVRSLEGKPYYRPLALPE